jgi:hypothetical protein
MPEVQMWGSGADGDSKHLCPTFSRTNVRFADIVTSDGADLRLER